MSLGESGETAWHAARAHKLCINAVLNPLAALLGVDNGSVARAMALKGAGAVTGVHALAEELAAEAWAWAYFGGFHSIFRDATDLLDAARDAAVATSANINSALADARSARLGESDFISGAVLRGAVGRGGDAPATRRVLSALHARERAFGVRTSMVDARVASIIQVAVAHTAQSARPAPFF